MQQKITLLALHFKEKVQHRFFLKSLSAKRVLCVQGNIFNKVNRDIVQKQDAV